MKKTVDARGLSCPQPVLMVMGAIKETQSGEIEVLVDTDTSRENVVRAATSNGFLVRDIRQDDTGYVVLIAKD